MVNSSHYRTWVDFEKKIEKKSFSIPLLPFVVTFPSKSVSCVTFPSKSVSCVHTNLDLDQRLELYETGMLPWDIEMTVEEPLSDDEDGVPHSVSDSESKSENDCD